MTIECRNQGEAAVVTVAGRMDAASAPAFEQACAKWLQDGAKHLAVDVTNLQYVSSMGLRSFLVTAKSTPRGARMMLCGLHGMVKDVFDMTHFTPLFALFETTPDADRSLWGSGRTRRQRPGGNPACRQDCVLARRPWPFRGGDQTGRAMGGKKTQDLSLCFQGRLPHDTLGIDACLEL